MSEGNCHTKGTKCHTQRTANQQRLTSPLLDGEHSHQRERNINNTHKYSKNHGVIHSHIAKDTWCIVKHSIDTYSLLEYREHDTHKDTERTIGEQLLGLNNHGILDILQNLLSLGCTVDLCQNTLGLLILANRNKVTWSFGYKADEQCKQACRYSLATKHITPTGSNSPLCSRRNLGNLLTDILNQWLQVVAQDKEVNEVNYQLTEDNGELVPAYKHTTDI